MSSGGRSEFLGYFAREIEAARAYDAAARRLYGAFACLNFPEEGTVVARPWSLVARSPVARGP